MAESTGEVRSRPRRFYRYPVIVRVAHGANAVCLLVLLMSGLQIFNAHPALYWGETSDFDRPLAFITSIRDADGRPSGATVIAGRRFDTTGVLGWSRTDGRPSARAFPAWATLPGPQDLATGRVWHFFAAWLFVALGLVYAGHLWLSGRGARELLPRRDEWRTIPHAVRSHLTLALRRERRGAYNILQKLVYLAVVLGLAPLVVLTGLTMSPAVTAAAPWLLDVFGGRQSARTLHFSASAAFAFFIVVHIVMVVVSGFIDNMRAIVTGWSAASREGPTHGP